MEVIQILKTNGFLTTRKKEKKRGMVHACTLSAAGYTPAKLVYIGRRITLLSFSRVSFSYPQRDSCHLWFLGERRKDRGASYRINFDFLNTFFGHVNI